MRALKITALALCCLGTFLVLLFLTAEAGVRWRADPILRRPHCSRPDPQEVQTLAPDCDAMEDSPAGEYAFHTNEDGFRDRPRSFFANGAIFLLGDSHAEGYRLPVEQGLARQLEARLHTPVLNVGMQGLGPGQEALRARRALEHYRPLGAIWLLNPSDPIDEIFFSAIRKGEPNPLAGPGMRDDLIPRLNRLLHGRSFLVKKLEEIFYLQRPYGRFLAGRKFDPAEHCRAIHELAGTFRERKVPLVFVVMGMGPSGEHLTYRGITPEDEDYLAMVACLKDYRWIDERGQFEDPSLYWPSDWHFTPAGTEKLADFLAPKLEAILSQRDVKAISRKTSR